MEDLGELLEDLSKCDLTAWEHDFVEDFQYRFETWGDKTFVSDRQREQFFKMKEKYL